MDCLFCKIIAGDIPSTKVYEDDKVLAFRDINPQAPTHILVIPKEHIEGVDELNAENAEVVSHIFVKIAEIAKAFGRLPRGIEHRRGRRSDGAASAFSYTRRQKAARGNGVSYGKDRRAAAQGGA